MLVLLAAGAALWAPQAAPAQLNFEPEYAGYSWQVRMHLNPEFGGIDMAFLPDGRILIAHKSGKVRLVSSNGLTTIGFPLNIESQVNYNTDAGLHSIALHPHFEEHPWLYAFYSVETDTANPDTSTIRYGRVSRFRMNPASNYTTVVAGSQEILIGATWPEGTLQEGSFHVGGCLRFGDDGMLLLSTGDSHSTLGYNPSNSASYLPGRFPSSMDVGPLRAQLLDNLSGKLLRFDPETGLGLPSNPFYTGNPADAQSRVFAYGLRMPWRFEVARGTGSHDATHGRPGALWIGDVGWEDYDELNVTSPQGGDNFGWPFYEGHLPIPLSIYSEANYTGPAPFAAFEDTAITASYGHFSNNPNWPEALIGTRQVRCIVPGVFYDYASLGHERSGLSGVSGLARKPENIASAAYDRRLHGPASFTSARHDSPYTPVLDNKHLLMDWGLNDMFLVDYDGFGQPVSFDLMASGRIHPQGFEEGFVDVDYNPATGKVFGLTYWRLYELAFDPAGAPPTALLTADQVAGPLPLQVTLDASETFNPSGSALSYEWHLDDGGAPVVTTEPTYTAVFNQDRNYDVAVRVTNAAMQSSTGTLTIFAGNIAPTAEIISPKPWHGYPEDGSPAVIRLEGEVTDPDGGTPPSYFWRVALGHDNHRHELATLTELNTTHTIHASEDPNTWHIFELFVTDDRGMTVFSRVNVYENQDAPASPLTAASSAWLESP